MKFTDTDVPGVVLLDLEPVRDDRGWFARTWSSELEDQFDLGIRECSAAQNAATHTLRGLHFQAPPGAEAKLVRCVRGSVFDVTLDLRRASGSFGRWFGVRLDCREPRQLFVPEGVAHGYLTLEPDTELEYQISTPYRPDLARGVRWDDPYFGIEWPTAPEVMSDRDRSFANFSNGLEGT